MVRLAREISRRVHVAFRSFELRIAQITPQNARHAELVRLRKGLTHFDDLTRRLLRSEIDRSPNAHRAEVVCFFDSSEHDLVELVRQRQQLVVIDFHDERNLVRILPRHRTEHAECRGDCITTTLDRQLRYSRDRSIPGSAQTKHQPNARCPGPPEVSTCNPYRPAGRDQTTTEANATRPASGRR